MGLKKGEELKTAFDSYTVVGQVGAGGSGEVYEVRDSDGEPYAIKVLAPTRAGRDRLKRFRNEVQFCSKNTHRNIVQVVASGVTGAGATFYVMPLYSGTLRQLMSGERPAPDRLRYFTQILDGIEAAHLLGVWHRDIKPENILFSEKDDLLVLADFGIAHFEEEELLTAVETRNNERLANFVYSAPEQKARGSRIDGKADVWALGLILNEMFTGAVPLGTDPARVSDAAPDYGYLDGLVETMLRQDPAARPSIDEVKRQLIARGNEFISIQRLNSLKAAVVPDTEVEDPIITNPVRIIGVDYRNDYLVFTLSAAPPPLWVMGFQRPTSSWSSFPGSGPESFTFRGNEASVLLPAEKLPNQLTQYAKHYVELANGQYVQRITEEHRKRIDRERQQRLAQIAEEERRQKVLRDLKL